MDNKMIKTKSMTTTTVAKDELDIYIEFKAARIDNYINSFILYFRRNVRICFETYLR